MELWQTTKMLVAVYALQVTFLISNYINQVALYLFALHKFPLLIHMGFKPFMTMVIKANLSSLAFDVIASFGHKKNYIPALISIVYPVGEAWRGYSCRF